MTMKLPRDQLEQQILDFMVAVHQCYANTNFAEDRSVYAQDLAEAMGWIAELRSGVDAEKIAEEMLGPATAKHFGDYWRQGEWGDKEADALKNLKANLTIDGVRLD